MDRIYIIEDDENIRNLLQIALEGFGYQAESFETAEEGLARMKEEPPSLAIFDWMLPGMDGIQAIKEVRRTEGLKNLPVMVLTAREKELDKVVGLDCGADDYMVKPFGVLEQFSSRYMSSSYSFKVSSTGRPPEFTSLVRRSTRIPSKANSSLLSSRLLLRNRLRTRADSSSTPKGFTM